MDKADWYYSDWTQDLIKNINIERDEISTLFRSGAYLADTSDRTSMLVAQAHGIDRALEGVLIFLEKGVKVERT